jgi:predicted 3-demethylubiquinone-9 3-methyltransferase (glyoxalase superfamily)
MYVTEWKVQSHSWAFSIIVYFQTLTEIDLLWNVYYLAAEFRLGGEPRNCTDGHLEKKINTKNLFSYLVVAQEQVKMSDSLEIPIWG